MNSSPFEKLFTPVEFEGCPGLLSHGAPVLTLGSCFADEVGSRLLEQLFDVEVNPFGALYNPVSLGLALQRIIDGTPYYIDDLICCNGRWCSLDFHSRMSGATPEEALAAINSTIERLRGLLPRLRLLVLTLGSARGFLYKRSGRIVGNCHKLPAADFEVCDLDIDRCTEALAAPLRNLREIAPELRVILTVSPVRHKSYGMHADRLSKATLLLAADRLCRTIPNALYFPAYEIMQDELRDYRFYAADMVHPSAEAADWITRRFIEAYTLPRTADLGMKLRKIAAALRHRPRSGERTTQIPADIMAQIPAECVAPLMRLSLTL